MSFAPANKKNVFSKNMMIAKVYMADKKTE